MNRKNSLYAALFCFVIAILCLCALAKADKWVAVWDANTEDDLAGYQLFVYPEEGVNADMVADVDTNYAEFEYQVPFCAYVKAYDFEGNLSDSSNVVCLTAQIPGDFNGDGAVNVLDNIAFNNAWHLFVSENRYDIKYDLYPVNAPDGQINMFDKLQFHIYWRP